MAWTPYTIPKPVAKAPNPVDDYFGRTPAAGDTLKPVSLPKIPGLDPMLASQATLAESQRKSREADLARFRAALGGVPAEAWASEETADIGRVFSPGGYESDLAGIRSRRAQGMAGLSDAVLGDLRRTLNLSAVGRGPSGLGSYLTRTASNAAARLRAQELADQSTQERSDLGALMAARAAMQGRRQTLTDATLSRLLQPAQAESTSLSQYQSALAQALQQALANSEIAYGMY